jgi:glycosyltransferase involved in cell wall biosynthesis/LmbE family N-acetylglucosaminyl deacetylase
METSAITIAVCIIAKNEEALIARCLESVTGADAIYVCDTGSQDKTVEIAKKYTNNVCLSYIWDDDFSGAQNHCKSHVKEDWILSLDCDEYLDCDFSEVRKAVELAEKYVSVLMISEGGGTLKFRFSRLFRNSPDIFWCQKIHKHLNLPGEGEPVGNVRIVFGWSPAHNNDPDRALRILERVVREEEDPGRNLYYLGREYWYKGRYQECTRTLGRYVQVSGWPAEKADAFLIMSQAYSAQGLDEDAKDAILQALKINSNFKEAVEWMAKLCGGTTENARQWKRMAKTANNNDILWEREKVFPARDILLIAPHNDDEALFAAYTLMRVKPLVIVATDSFIQPNRGETGCSAEERRAETIKAMELAGCPVLFLGIKDTELTEDILRSRLKYFDPETVYIPAIQGGNAQHDLVGKVGMELWGKNCERYTSYTKTELYTTGGWEIVPTQQEMELKNKMLDCYKSQLALPSTAPHFAAVRNRSEWLI